MSPLKIAALLLAVAALFAPQAAHSQELLTLQEAVSLGLQKNYSIRIAATQDDIDANNATLGNAGFLPTVTGRASRDFTDFNTRNQFESETPREIDHSKTNTTAASVALAWTVFDGGRMFIEYDRLQAIERSGQLLTKTTIENTIADISDAYYNVVRQARKIQSLEDAIAISEQRVAITQEQYNVGVSAKVEILRAQVDYNADRSELLRQLEVLQNAKINLNQLLGRDPGINFTPADSIEVDRQIAYDGGQANLLNENPSLQRLQVQREIALNELQLARAQRYPSIGFSGSYGYNRSLQDPVIYGNIQGTNESRRYGFNYGLTLSLPIFNGFNINRQVQNARVNIELNELQFAQEQNRLAAELARAYSQYTNRLELLQLEEDNVKLAEQNAEIALERYRLGLLTAIELREAQRNELVAQNRLIDIKYEAKAAEVEIKRLTSSLLQDEQL
ncbi:TolC family protein [Pontibacter actiniarum]|uniref:Transporter n=1 Tax=Pontibacter actiniarum TaxID=323450 RepID=A0A1X9YTS6_9BACT|nr:TolC family protein [Pontibacter actiniarum]ARS36287.1 transporter [Pontibacter actiniarum]